MNLLVTGAAGFIGSRLCRELLRRGYSVCGLSHRAQPESLKSLPGEKAFHLLTGDIQDAASMQRLVQENQIEAVFHLAARLPEKNDGADKFSFFDVNARGTLNLLEAAASNKVKHFIYASTMSVYTEPPQLVPVTESDAARPHSLYGVSKLSGELLCHAYSSQMKIAILRYGGAYGTGQRASDAVSRFIQQARAGQPLTVYGDGKQTSDYVYVDDVVRGTIAVLEKNVHGVYNIGSGEETSVKDLAEQILKITGSGSKITYTAVETDRPFRFYLDITRAQKELGYRARSLAEGLRIYLLELGPQE
jgi:UDP-glucuronate 4-epimerase